ncbi:pyrroloquinoline quinone biosynthesis protein PqqF [Pseudomonas rubra]|uniref:Pyrroloquinoline quinone biosynthesis protein PqqF n=1 Tax=Pseudomonas rubra TaxID=2942627 RepID=A0ABT5PFJ2_9PSED|nr:pyrroloquinoline quinone biosynthesis protein PqqF [Pseudomonas rubra]MDD1016971.1 pyrroloquinoline quinone biosynthesis protein PqqF [Pseudomonas rubra]MDD1041032.1 pyrroloquinoline quinone biosynthesis protein PqqF [Pseudomonas rubra]MDD1157459.1 pyrroloquinoline quinone biosynthesis protein PqqF [Pseudomonas rubra]
MPSDIRLLTLDNGLQVSLRHAPQLKRCAAAVRVRAGSHDAPRAWPGLAHFLEHLFFLGNQRFVLEDGLMRYVQHHGGQVNASTRERTTEFFFEVPPAAFAGGLERLCEMLAQPCFELERQLREREVIHAEFIAWSRSSQAQRQFVLLQSAGNEHPLSAFHAGNRYSLQVQSQAFQAALRDFHQRFYHAGQITLSLSGPQSLEALESLAHQYAHVFSAGTQVPQSLPPSFNSRAPLRLHNEQQLDLLYPCEHLHAGAEHAIDFLATWLSNTQPGGLQATLRERNWLAKFEFSSLYSFAGQTLLHAGLTLTDAADAEQAYALLSDWLAFLRTADLSSINQEYGRLQQCRELSAGALELARRDSAGQPFRALDEQGLAALGLLLETMLDGQLHTASEPWRLPPANPLLNVTPVTVPATAVPEGLALSPLLPSTRQHAVIYLRWQLTSALRERLWQVLDRGLEALREQAAQAGVQVQLSSCDRYWQLRCAGNGAVVVAVVEQALAILRYPCSQSWTPGTAEQPDAMPIRALLRQLPEQLLGRVDEALPAYTISQSDLDALWECSTWNGLATGFSATEQSALNHALGKVPGRAGPHLPARIEAVRRWQTLPPAASEQALLLFCPVADHAAGRLLAQQLQGPFYQRLRVELNLGYAVFSAFRQIEGCDGLLFGVQSPSASHAEIVGHIQTLLDDLADQLSCTDTDKQALAAQFDEPAMANHDVAEWAWQAHLAGNHHAQLSDLQAAILALDTPQLRRLARQTSQGELGWLCLANGPAPGAHWH